MESKELELLQVSVNRFGNVEAEIKYTEIELTSGKQEYITEIRDMNLCLKDDVLPIINTLIDDNESKVELLTVLQYLNFLKKQNKVEVKINER